MSEARSHREASAPHTGWAYGFLLGFGLVILVMAVLAAFRKDWEYAAVRNIYSRRYYGRDYGTLTGEEKESVQRHTPRAHGSGMRG